MTQRAVWLGWLLVGCLCWAQQVSAHDWLVFGERQVFASLVARFDPPGNFRLVLHLDLPTNQRRVLLKHLRAGRVLRMQSPDVDLLRFTPGDAQYARALTGTLYAPNKPGKAVTAHTFRVRQTLVFAELDPFERAPKALSYTAFGAGREWYAAKVLLGPPDFDQLLRLPKLPRTVHINTALNNSPKLAKNALRGASVLYLACIDPCERQP